MITTAPIKGQSGYHKVLKDGVETDVIIGINDRSGGNYRFGGKTYEAWRRGHGGIIAAGTLAQVRTQLEGVL